MQIATMITSAAEKGTPSIPKAIMIKYSENPITSHRAKVRKMDHSAELGLLNVESPSVKESSSPPIFSVKRAGAGRSTRSTSRRACTGK